MMVRQEHNLRVQLTRYSNNPTDCVNPGQSTNQSYFNTWSDNYFRFIYSSDRYTSRKQLSGGSNKYKYSSFCSR